MAATITMPRTFLSGIAHACTRITRRKDGHAALVAALQATRLVPAAVVPGLEHQAAAAFVRTVLPAVTYERRTVGQQLAEHVFLDPDAGMGVRVKACWDDRARRLRMQVAEAGERGLWDRIVVHFTEWEMTGHPVPADDADSADPHGSATDVRRIPAVRRAER